MSAPAVVCAVAEDFVLAVDVESVVTSPTALEYWVVDIESSSVSCSFRAVPIPPRNGHHILQDFSVTERNNGVRDGILGDCEVRLLQPSLGHARFVQRQKSSSLSDSSRGLNRQLKDCEIQVGSFGKVTCSSGYRMEEYESFPDKSRQV